MKMIGIIGYGMVGKAVEYGFQNCSLIISDPKYNEIQISDICLINPEAIFICVPTPTDDNNYTLIKRILKEIKESDYDGLVVVKSTILPHHLEGFDVIYNPEFLSRKTSNEDFVKPPMVIIGGNKGQELLEIYQKYSIVDLSNVHLVDIKTASLLKYTMNCFYALKVTYMNEIYDIAQSMQIDYNQFIKILAEHPWMGNNHFQVPGPDGERGFGGPCLPKDTAALVREYNVEILKRALEINGKYRKTD